VRFFLFYVSLDTSDYFLVASEQQYGHLLTTCINLFLAVISLVLSDLEATLFLGFIYMFIGDFKLTRCEQRMVVCLDGHCVGAAMD